MQGPRIKLVFVIRYIMAAVNSHPLTRLALLLFYFISLEVNITKIACHWESTNFSVLKTLTKLTLKTPRNVKWMFSYRYRIVITEYSWSFAYHNLLHED